MANLSVFREIFKEAVGFTTRVHQILEAHDDKFPHNKRKAGGGLGGTRTHKKKKTGPTRPLTAYMLFVRHERKLVVDENPDAKFPDVGKIMGARWKNLPQRERDRYNKMAEEDKERHAAEMKLYAQRHPRQDVDAGDISGSDDSDSLGASGVLHGDVGVDGGLGQDVDSSELVPMGMHLNDLVGQEQQMQAHAVGAATSTSHRHRAPNENPHHHPS